MKSTNRRCSHCKKKVPADSAVIGGLRAFCSYEHLMAFTQSEAGKKAVVKQIKKEIKEDRVRLKTRGDHIREAQAAFNAYIRKRDEGKPCISCGANPESRFGGGADAGHYRSRGSAGHLRFHLLNVHSQCKRCNRYLSGNVSEYRIGLIQRIGLERVEELECDQTERRMSEQYLQRIKNIFIRKKRLYEKLRMV